MSRNIYDPATDTLTPIAGCNGMDSDFSSTSQNALKNSVITNAMGALSSLSTSNKSSLVNAINEVNTKSINNQGNFAYINTNSTTASKAYTSGEQFILDGVLRRARTAIASGATLTLNSNYENAPSVTSQISNLKNQIPPQSFNVNIDVAQGQLSINRQNSICIYNSIVLINCTFALNNALTSQVCFYLRKPDLQSALNIYSVSDLIAIDMTDGNSLPMYSDPTIDRILLNGVISRMQVGHNYILTGIVCISI